MERYREPQVGSPMRFRRQGFDVKGHHIGHLRIHLRFYNGMQSFRLDQLSGIAVFRLFKFPAVVSSAFLQQMFRAARAG